MLNEVEVAGIADPYKNAREKGWDIVNASALDTDLVLETDVVIVGSGAGGGTSAEILSAAGLNVVILEEGMLKSSDQFDMVERYGLTDLYQEGGLQTTQDGAVAVVQGRNVGGGTTVNWCSTFRTPPQTLNHWRERFGLKACSVEEMAPFFKHMEDKLSVQKWPAPPNQNNEILKRGAQALGYTWDIIPRNVDGCWNLGYCGVGCPVDAKKSMLVTTVPAALENGSKLVYRAGVERLLLEGDRVTGVKALASTQDGHSQTGHTITVKAKHVVLAAGGIHTPGILLRSGAPDPFGRIGKRTFLHPVTVSFGQFDEKIDPYYGAPQSIYSDQFTWSGGVEGPMGYKLEVIPLLPGVYASVTKGHGESLHESMRSLSNTQGMMAFLRDGFHEESQGGTVELTDGGRPVLNYPLTDYIRNGIRRALMSMAEIQFAAGARAVRAAHAAASWQPTLSGARSTIDQLAIDPGQIGLSSAHVMGGCAMGEDEKVCVTDSNGRFRGLENLSIFDGSLFPSSLGANPQMSIFGFSRKFSQRLAKDLGAG